MIHLRLLNYGKKAANEMVSLEIENLRRCMRDLDIKDLDKNFLRVLSDLGVSKMNEEVLDWTEKIEDGSSTKVKIEINLDDDEGGAEASKPSKPAEDLLFDSQLGFVGSNGGNSTTMNDAANGIQSILTSRPPTRLNTEEILGGVGGHGEAESGGNRPGDRNTGGKGKRGHNPKGGNGSRGGINSSIGNSKQIAIKAVDIQEMGVEGDNNISNDGTEGEEVARVQVTSDVAIKLDRKAIQNKLKGIDLYAAYSRNKSVNRASGQALVVPQEFQDAVEKQEHWTYKKLAQNSAIDGMIEIIIENVRMLQIAHKLASNTNSAPDIEWILLFDNSGSMARIADSCAEILAILAEVLRKLEFKFAVGTLGASARLIKTLDEPFTHVVGERILACFSYNERTNILSCTEEILGKVRIETYYTQHIYCNKQLPMLFRSSRRSQKIVQREF